MAATRGRSISNMGYHLFAGASGGEPLAAGQPTMIRTWGIPTGPGWRDRPGKWNVIFLPFAWMLFEILKRIRS